MTRRIARFEGLILVLVAIAAGVLIGRVIEAIAVGAVLFAVWTSVWRLVSAPADTIGAGTDGGGR